MPEPQIVCVMCTRNRREWMLAALGCWDRQTYGNRRLFIYDNGEFDPAAAAALDGTVIYRHAPPTGGGRPLSRVMNDANNMALAAFPAATWIAKWDDDDYSVPTRLEHSMHVARSTGAWVTGFNEMPIFDTADGAVYHYNNPAVNYAMGTSLLISTRAWRQQNFPDTATGRGADTVFVTRWAARGRVVATSGMPHGEPLMVARLHDGNTSMRPNGAWKKANANLRAATLRALGLNEKGE